MSYFLDLKRPLSILYLSGPSWTGKSLTKDALSRLFRKTGPVDAKKFTGQFNAEILECPFIACDDYRDPTGELTGALLRVTGSNSIPIEQKYIQSQTVRGNIRAVFCYNNPLMLRLADSVDIAQLEAINNRIFYVEYQQGAVDFLRKFTDVEIAEWRDRKLAEHVLWLNQNRSQASTLPPYVVPGIKHSMMYRALLLSKPSVRDTCRWIMRHIKAKTATAAVSSKRLLIGVEGRFINPYVLNEFDLRMHNLASFKFAEEDLKSSILMMQVPEISLLDKFLVLRERGFVELDDGYLKIFCSDGQNDDTYNADLKAYERFVDVPWTGEFK